MSTEATEPAIPVRAVESTGRVARSGRFVAFIAVVLLVWSAMHLYVGWRLRSLPGLGDSTLLVVVLLLLAICFPAARILRQVGGASFPEAVENVGALWLGVLFQLLFWLLLADLVSGFGWLLPDAAVPARIVAVAVAVGSSLVGLLQAMRGPTVVDHELVLPHLAATHDGRVIVHLTDLHVGRAAEAAWLRDLADRVATLAPDLIAFTGDVVDGRPEELTPLVVEFAKFKAPLGVWAVSGNHEYYMGLEASLQLMRDAGFQVLRDGWREAAPGLVVAGVDDLTARRQLGRGHGAVATALGGRPPAATLYLCHSPLEVERAAALGADLMLSGHTHGGQIWPFGWLVKLAYPYLAGRFQVGKMMLLVSRGTGTWGPRMRLFHRSEIHRITLRAG